MARRRRLMGFYVTAAVTIAAFAACDKPGDGDLTADYEVVPSGPVKSLAVTPSEDPGPKPLPTTTGSMNAPTLASASASSSASATPSGSASSAPPAKTFDCGEKGKPDCPMQRWMKGVAGNAVSSGDNDKLAHAFQAMAGHPAPGTKSWAAISGAGAAKAQAGDFDGAKAECKHCHSLNQRSYHANNRDAKWP